MKYKVYNNSEYFGDKLPEYVEGISNAESMREQIIESLIELHREEALREFYDSDEGKQIIGDIEERFINDGLREEVKDAIVIEEVGVN